MSAVDRPAGRRCIECGGPIPITKKGGARFCSDLHKSRWHNKQRRSTEKRLPRPERRESEVSAASHSPGAVQFWLSVGAFRRRRPAVRAA